MTRRTAAMQLALITALSVQSVSAATGSIFLSNTWWISESLPEGAWIMNMANGDTTRVSPNFYRCGAISTDGRELAGYVWDGWEIMNNDGTNRRRLCTADHDQYFNMGWLERVAFTDRGLWWVCTDADFTFKRLMFCDRYTGVITLAADLSAYGDAVQGYCASDDGLRGMAWLHEETITVSFASHMTSPTVRVMTGVWGHGPLLTPHGDRVLINAMSSDRDLGAGNPDHKTWVVYDFAAGVLGTFLDRFALSSLPNKIGIGAQWIVRNDNSHLVFQTENDGNRYLVNWQTHAMEQLPVKNGGKVMEAWMGALPNPHADVPAIGLNKNALEFLSVSGNPAGQSVTVSNLGTGTLDNVTTAISPTVSGSWLSVSRSGSGNTQTLANTINAGSLANGVYSARVTVSAANSSVSPSYTVTFTLGSQVAAASELLLDVAYNGADITLHWNDNSSNETGFIVERSVNSGAFTEIARAGANARAYANTGLGAGTYAYRVIAYDAVGNAAPSNTRTETLTGNPRFAVTNPKTGDTLQAGSALTVQWSSEIASLVEVMISADEETWTTLNAMGGIGSNDTEWGNFTTTVPNLPSANATLKVRKYGDELVKVEIRGLVVVAPAGANHGIAAASPAAWRRAVLGDRTVRIEGPENRSVTGALYSLQGSRLAVFAGRTNEPLHIKPAAGTINPRAARLVVIRETGTEMERILPVHAW